MFKNRLVMSFERPLCCADYHLHVHVAHVQLDGGAGMAAGKAHLLDDVIGAALAVPPHVCLHCMHQTGHPQPSRDTHIIACIARTV